MRRKLAFNLGRGRHDFVQERSNNGSDVHIVKDCEESINERDKMAFTFTFDNWFDMGEWT